MDSMTEQNNSLELSPTKPHDPNSTVNTQPMELNPNLRINGNRFQFNTFRKWNYILITVSIHYHSVTREIIVTLI